MGKIKKIGLTLVVLLIVFMYQKAYATLNCVASITSVTEITQGEEFELSIGINDIQGDRGVFTFGGTVEYDKKLLTCIEYTGGNNWSTSYNEETRKFVADRNNGFATTNETVIKFKFKVNETATGKTTINLKKVAVANGKELTDIKDVSKTISIKAKDTDKNEIPGEDTNQGNQTENTVPGGDTNQGNQTENTVPGGNTNQGNQIGNTGNTNQIGSTNSSKPNNNNKVNTTTKKPTTTNKTNTNNVNNTVIELNTINNKIDNSIIDNSIIDTSNTIGNEIDIFSNEESIVKDDTKAHKKNNSVMVIFIISTVGAIAIIGGVFFARNKPNFNIKFKVDK